MAANHHGSDESNAEPECRPDLKVEKQTFFNIVIEHLLVSYNLNRPTNYRTDAILSPHLAQTH